MLKLVIPIILIFSIYSCQPPIEEKAKNEINNNVKSHYIENSEFVDSAFGYNFSMTGLVSGNNDFHISSTKLINNKHKVGQIDTIYTFKLDQSVIEVYKIRQKEFLKSVYLDSKKVVLKNGIVVGMKREEFFRKIDLTIIVGEIQIGNLERTNVFTFNFEKGRLKTISYSGYID